MFVRCPLPRWLAVIFTALVVLGTAVQARADWRVGPGSEMFTGTNSAFGIADTGVHVLGVMCSEGAPLVWTQGYPAAPGPNRQETFTVEAGGFRFAVTGEHAPPDGLWTGRADPRLIDALQSGNRASVTVPGQATQGYGLQGSSAALATVLQGCGGATPTNTTPAVFDQVIVAACGGAYTLADGAEFTGLLDGDATPDVILDWAGVTCVDPSKGRGAGFCGAALCTIDVAFSSTEARKQILGVAPRLLDRGFGRHALQTSTQGATCGSPARACDVIWRWTGQALEPIE